MDANIKHILIAVYQKCTLMSVFLISFIRRVNEYVSNLQTALSAVSQTCANSRMSPLC